MFIKNRKKLINNTNRIFVILLYTLIIFLTGVLFRNSGIIGHVLEPKVKSYSKIFFRYLKSISSNPERIIINIKHKDYQKIINIRKQALNKGTLDWVPIIDFNEGIIKTIEWYRQYLDTMGRSGALVKLTN